MEEYEPNKVHWIELTDDVTKGKAYEQLNDMQEKYNILDVKYQSHPLLTEGIGFNQNKIRKVTSILVKFINFKENKNYEK